MKSGKCPKCGSADVRCKRGAGKWSEVGRIPGPGAMGMGLLVDRYVCAGCGFVETWLANDDDRGKVREKWPLATDPRRD